MSDKYEQAAKEIGKPDFIYFNAESFCFTVDTVKVAAYLRSQFPEPVKIEGVRELVLEIMFESIEDIDAIDEMNAQTERLIIDFIQNRESVCGIESAPWGVEVLLFGESGCNKPHDRFVINGYRLKDWHMGEWNDSTGTPLSDSGWHPTHWQPLPPAPKE